MDEATIAQDLYQGMRGFRNYCQVWGGGGGEGGPGPSVINNSLTTFFFKILFSSPSIILQNANGLFQRKL